MKDIIITGTALVTFRTVISDVPEDEIQDFLKSSEASLCCNVNDFDLQYITGLEDWNITLR